MGENKPPNPRKEATLMRFKLTPLLMSILACVITVSVGFSSWLTIHPPQNNDSSGNITSYPVFGSTDFIRNDGVTMFSFSSLSFLGEGKEESDKGYVVARYTLMLDQCYATVGAESWDGTLTLLLSMWYTAPAEQVNDLFRDVDDGTNKRVITASASPSIQSVSVSGGRSSTTNYSAVSSTFTVSNLPSSGTCEITVTYEFDIPKNLQDGSDIPANFRQMFGKYIKVVGDDKTQFLSTARIAEVE